jgi:hypothetical protein
VWTNEEEMVNRFANSVLAVGAVWGVRPLYPVEDGVEWDISRPQLSEETRLVAP